MKQNFAGLLKDKLSVAKRNHVVIARQEVEAGAEGCLFQSDEDHYGVF